MSLAQLNDPFVGVVACDAVEYCMFSGKEVAILRGKIDEAFMSLDRFRTTGVVTLAASFRVAVDLHRDAFRIRDVKAAWTVAFFALDSVQGPCANQAGQAVLVTSGIVTRGVAGNTRCREVFLTSMV